MHKNGLDPAFETLAPFLAAGSWHKEIITISGPDGAFYLCILNLRLKDTLTIIPVVH